MRMNPDERVVVEDYTNYEGDMVESVKIIASPDHECGWKYHLHFGETAGNTVLRYDNSHADSVGHERHTANDDELIDFPGMKELKQRFDREVDEWWRKQG